MTQNKAHITVVDNGTDCLEDLVRLLEASHSAYTILSLQDLRSANIPATDTVVLTGGLWYDEQTPEVYADELTLIAEDRDIPIVGICLGMQLIVTAFGGDTAPLDHRVSGEKEIRLTDMGMKVLQWRNSVTVSENHSVSIVKLPQIFEVLAYSDDGFEIVKHQRLPIIGVQFHPEKSHHAQVLEQWNSLLLAGKQQYDIEISRKGIITKSLPAIKEKLGLIDG